MKEFPKSLVLILGMHRSGTSLVAKAAQVAGVALGGHLMAPARDNPKGFFEDTDVFDFNQRLLDEIDMRWDIPSLLLENHWGSPDYGPWVAEAASLLENRTQRRRLFGMKDPRLCLTAPIWLKAAEKAGLTPSFIVVVRNPLDVARSLKVRNEFSLRKGLALWLSYNYLLLDLLLKHAGRRLFIEYQNVLLHPREEVARLHDLLGGHDGLSPTQESEAEKFVTTFVDRSLNHSSSNIGDLMKSVAGTVEAENIVKLYQCFSQFALSGWSEKQAKEVFEATSPLHLESSFYRQQLGYFKAELRLKNEEIAHSGAQNAELLKMIETKQKEAETLKNEHEKEMRALVDQKDAERRELDAELLTLKRSNEKQVKELESAVQEITRRSVEAEGTIAVIKSSLSYRAGWYLTRPISVPYHAFVKPFLKYPQNLRLAGYAVYYLFRHPIKATRLLNRENIRKTHIVFFKQPELARDVVGRIGRMLHGKGPGASSIIFKRAHDQSEAGNDVRSSVSVFIINYNGMQHLPDLLSSLYIQDHGDFEIIMVDNASRDRSVEYVQENYPAIKIIALPENVGFAEGNNIAAEVATGRYYCLVNNDAVADSAWLSALVRCIRKSPEIGAVGSKILFWKKFVTIDIRVQSKVKPADEIVFDVDALDQSATVYRKPFFAWGWGEEKRFQKCTVRPIEGNGGLYFPICEGQTRVRLRMFSETEHIVAVETSVAAVTRELRLCSGVWQDIELDFTGNLEDPGLNWIINNAGSEATDKGEVRDRGFAALDDGGYDEVEEVTALCGGAMLIRPEVLNGLPLFARQFFAYFEDTELSRRILEAGYKLLYCPESRLYHKHASTSKENSPAFRYYVNRNRILFLALHYPETLWKKELEHAKSHLNHLKTYYDGVSGSADDQKFAASIPQIFEDWGKLIPDIQDGVLLQRENRFPRIAVFNNFWNTLGGGEHHACVVAQALQSMGPVDLISENDFSIEALEGQFDVNLKYCRKVIISASDLHHDPSATGQYDIFVNSTFSSDLISRARHSYYIVSFPFRLLSRSPEANRFLQTYRFLANSKYTKEWISRWWNVDSDVLYPSIRIPHDQFDIDEKTKLILHVGRFFRVGHNKKQLELLEVFKDLTDCGALSKGWRLVFVGQVSDIDLEYVEELRDKSHEYPVEILTNQPLEALVSLYKKAAIYWHATGLGDQTSEHPELNEHFGITTVEAMSYGCVPVVINAGGQPETVEQDVSGFLFNDEDELKQCTLRCIRMFEREPDKFNKMSMRAYLKAKKFARENTQARLTDILAGDGVQLSRTDRLL